MGILIHILFLVTGGFLPNTTARPLKLTIRSSDF